MPRIVPCRTCKAPMFWVEMRPSGKKNPLDEQPSEKGCVLVGGDGTARVLVGGELAAARSLGMKLYLSHYATCPDAKQWRKPK